MNFEGLIPVIKCQHIEQTLEFYQQALRYIIIRKTETEAGLQWAYIKSDNTFLMLQKNTNSMDSSDDSFSELSQDLSQDLSEKLSANSTQATNILLHFYTGDVAAQRQFMAAKGIMVGQLEDTAYHIRQFFVEDPEGNKIVIGQDIKNQLS